MRCLLLQGTATHIPLRSESVQCVVTSPPYWGLRAYAGEQSLVWGGDSGHEHEWGAPLPAHHLGQVPDGKYQHEEAVAAGQNEGGGHFCPCGAWYGSLGLEPTPELYVEHMVAIFREVRRVLRPDGTVWLNLGDSYCSQAPGARDPERWPKQSRNEHQAPRDPSRPRYESLGLKPKDLVMMPFEVARALRLDGWWVRSGIVWSKPNPMPESVTDRPTKAHDYLFLLTKSGAPIFWTHRDGDFPGQRTLPEPDYRWIEPRPDDAPLGWTPEESHDPVDGWGRINLWRGHDYFYDGDAIREQQSGNTHARRSDGRRDVNEATAKVGNITHLGWEDTYTEVPGGRNARTVWTIATQPYPGAHFAVFPEELAERCVEAGSSRQACAECGAPWARVLGEAEQAEGRGSGNKERRIADAAGEHGRLDTHMGSSIPWSPNKRPTTGWQPTCEHTDGSGRSVVLDPFCGTSATGVAAIRNVRDYVGLDISREYLVEHSRHRVANLQGVLL